MKNIFKQLKGKKIDYLILSIYISGISVGIVSNKFIYDEMIKTSKNSP